MSSFAVRGRFTSWVRAPVKGWPNRARHRSIHLATTLVQDNDSPLIRPVDVLVCPEFLPVTLLPPDDPRRRLNVRERQVRQAMLAGQSRKQIALSLGISLRAVATHEQEMMSKMEARSAAEIRL